MSKMDVLFESLLVMVVRRGMNAAGYYGEVLARCRNKSSTSLREKVKTGARNPCK